MIESLQHLPHSADSHSALSAQFTDLAPPLNPRQAAIEAARCLYCYDAPCTRACPTGIDVASFIRNIHDQNIDGAAHGILKQNILGGSCARVCPTEILCEHACVRNHDAEGQPVRIGQRRFDRPMDLAVVDVTLLRPEDVLSVREATRTANVV